MKNSNERDGFKMNSGHVLNQQDYIRKMGKITLRITFPVKCKNYLLHKNFENYFFSTALRITFLIKFGKYISHISRERLNRGSIREIHFSNLGEECQEMLNYLLILRNVILED